MELIDTKLEGREDLEGLKMFLAACCDAADTDQHWKVASIALGVRHIDPLAVLDSIYEGAVHHFYMENRMREWAVAGAEAIMRASFEGSGRFKGVKAFAEELDGHTIAIGEMSLPMTGPLCFCGFTFYENSSGHATAFPPAQVFVPQWQVARRSGRYVAVANVLVHPGMDIAPAAERIWKAHQTFVAGNYGKAPTPPIYHILSEQEVGSAGCFKGNVERALARIQDGAYEKIVLSRALDLCFDNSCQPLGILNRLRQEFPNCNAFSLQEASGPSFIGATPERLISTWEGSFQTEAIAGSAGRASGAAADAQLARGLLSSEKDLREHAHVVSSIIRRLAAPDLEVEYDPQPGLLALTNVQHLCTPIRGQLGPGQHLLDLAEVLHPTPAVGGSPREASLPDIARWEPFDRGMFAGLTGWFDLRGNGEFAVAIRSALVHAAKARLYAGAGIVRGSLPQLEYQETSLKMAALLRCIRGAAGPTV